MLSDAGARGAGTGNDRRRNAPNGNRFVNGMSDTGAIEPEKTSAEP
jgi:hypothetical protein